MIMSANGKMFPSTVIEHFLMFESSAELLWYYVALLATQDTREILVTEEQVLSGFWILEEALRTSKSYLGPFGTSL